VDTYFTKANTFYFKAFSAKTVEEAEGFAAEFVKGIVKEIEPLLEDARPFFGGSEKLTLAEVSHSRLPKYPLRHAAIGCEFVVD
jgi:glutathione S-transferase